MPGPFLGRFPKPVFDISSDLDRISGDPALLVDNYARELFSGLHGVRQLGKMFVVGFLPPEMTTNFVAFEQQNRAISTVFGGGTSPNKGKKKEENTSINQVKKAGVEINDIDLGSSYYRSLTSRGYTDEQARRMAPLLVGVTTAELGKKGNSVTTDNYNVANILTGKPGNGLTGKNKVDPIPPSGGIYVSGTTTIGGKEVPCYYVASTNLQDATDKHVDSLITSGLTPDIQNDNKLVQIVRPDIANVPEAVYYNSSVGIGADSFSTGLALTGKSIDSFVAPDGPGTVSNPSVTIMGSSLVTDEDAEDPFKGSGRNIRVANGRKKDAADAQVRFIKQQVAYIQSIPPLAMVIGPSEFNRTYEPTFDVPKGRSGNIVHMWLEKPISISASGSTAIQYAFNSQGNGGMTHQNRIYSLSYKNLMSLVRIYRNNGYIYAGSGAFGQGNDGVPLFAISTYMYHDGRIYIGSFDNFSITDSADKPHNLNYSFNFTVRYEIEAADATSGGSFV